MIMLFSKYSWCLRLAVSVSKFRKFGVALKNWPKTCIICILKNHELPDLTHDHVILEVHLVPQDNCKCFQNNEIWVCLEKLIQKHVSYVYTKKWSTPWPSPWRCCSRLERLLIHKIWIPHEKLGYLHVYCPGITRIEERILAGDHGVSDDEVLLPPGDDV